MSHVKVKLLTARVEVIDGEQRSQVPGEVVEVPANEAARLLNTGQAEPVGDAPQPVTRREAPKAKQESKSAKDKDTDESKDENAKDDESKDEAKSENAD